tara:strand:+ start:233 stop:451 length:219 start_codon:yes stop_codon:yes gene_type:complete
MLKRTQTFQEFDNDNGEILHIILSQETDCWRIAKLIDCEWVIESKVIDNLDSARNIFDELIDDAKNNGWEKR